MITLNEAVGNRFPQTSEWARQALGTLAGDFEPSTPVHDVSIGWMRRGPADSGEHVETLFVLTDDRLGFGQTNAGAGDPRWIPLDAVNNVDALGASASALLTIELSLDGNLTMCVGWTQQFARRLVEVLIALRDGVSVEDAPADDSMPVELAHPDVIHADPSDLEDLPPSTWVESDLAEPAPPSSPPPPANPSAWFTMPPEVDNEPISTGAFDQVDDSGSIFDPNLPFDAPGAFGEPDSFVSLDDVEDVATSNSSPEPERVPEPEPDFFDGPNPFLEAETFEEPPAAPPVGSAEPAPWENPSLVWPEPIRGLLYLGGHPAQPRRRKNGTLVFSRAGIDVSGTGFQSWAMSMDWEFIDGIEIMGPDELMFSDNMKIEPSSTAFVVRMLDGTRMFFEIRSRRPPSVRSALAPAMIFVGGLPAYRAAS